MPYPVNYDELYYHWYFTQSTIKPGGRQPGFNRELLIFCCPPF